MALSEDQLQKDIISYFKVEYSQELSLQELIILGLGKNYNKLTFDELHEWMSQNMRRFPTKTNFMPNAKTISEIVRRLLEQTKIVYTNENNRYYIKLTMKGLAQYDILSQRLEL